MGKINDEDLEDLAKSKIVEQRQELEKVGREGARRGQGGRVSGEGGMSDKILRRE